MNQKQVDYNFNIGYSRTCDLVNVIEDNDEGECELVGIIVAANEALALRWGVDEKEALKRVRRLL